MKQVWWIILLIALTAACAQAPQETAAPQIAEATAVPPTATPTDAPVPTATASPTITPTPTNTATPTITPSPTNTPTPELPVGLATAVPQPLHILNPGNANQIVELARYGSGELLSVTHSADETALFVVLTTGVIIYDLDTFTPRLAVETIISDDADNPYAIAPDGSYLAVVSGDTVNVWDMTDGQLRHSFSLGEPPFSVFDLAFSPNGQSLTLVASLPSELTLWLWRLEDGAELLRQPGRKARFWPNGDLLMTCCAEFSADVQLWQPSDGTLVGTLTGPPWPVQLFDLAFDPTGAQAAIAYKNSIWLWDVTEQQVAQQFNRANGERGGELAFIDDGQVISMYSYEYDSLRLWDVAEGTLIADLPNQHNPVISPDHSRLFTQDFNRDAFSFATVLWNLETNRELLRVTGNMPADFAADGATAVINGSRDNPTRLLQSSDAAILQTFADENFALVLPDGDTIVTRNWEGLKFRDAVNGRAQHTLEGYFHHLLPDGHTIITWDNGRIMVGDATDGQQIHTADLPLPGINYVWQEARSPAGLIPAAYLPFLQTVDSPQNAATFSGDGRFRLINNGREIEVWDEANYSGQGPYDVLYTIPAPGINNQLIVSPDSQMIAAVQNNNTISVWQAADGTPLLTLPPVPWIQDLQFSPDNQLLLATTSSDYTEALRVWELPSGNQILADSYGLEFHNNGSISYCYGQPLALAPDGGLAAYSDGHCQIQIVQTSDWQVLQTIDPGFGRNGRIAFSPDGQLLATAFQGGVINLWDTASGQLLHTIIDHDNPVDDEPTVQITFSDDGQLLGTSGNGILHLWGIWP